MWQRRAKHCPLCAAPLAPVELEGRRRVRCPACEFVLYENPAAASAGLVVDAHARVLLVRRAIEPFRGSWALPAGYQEIDERPAETAVREVREESGIEVEVLSLVDLLFVSEDVRRPANVAVFLCRPIGGRLSPGADVLEAEWFALDGLPADLGFANRPLILERLRRAPGG